MNKPLDTEKACTIFSEMGVLIRDFLLNLGKGRFHEAESIVATLTETLESKLQANTAQQEELLNDFFVLERYRDFLLLYLLLWKRILNGKYSNSWVTLQDALDQLRLIKRFSRIDIGFFEHQLGELEKAYPYKVFCSMGAIFEYFECSICGFDTSSPECNHLRGQLYAGRLARVTPKNLKEVNHLALTANPVDKRCVVPVYDDTDEAFKVVQYLSELVKEQKIPVLNFSGLAFSKRTALNPEYKILGRNETCFCKSGKKFKKCCETKKYVEIDHVDILGASNNPEELVQTIILNNESRLAKQNEK